MKNPLLTFCRWLAMRGHKSTVPTALMPLSKIHSATVYVDGLDPDEDPTGVCWEIHRFFDKLEIPVLILCPQKGDLNLLGYLRKRVRGEQGSRQEELFISLAGLPDDFASEYEARCSTACFKVGRNNLSGGVYDLVVATPEDEPATQAAAFKVIQEYLSKIR